MNFEVIGACKICKSFYIDCKVIIQLHLSYSLLYAVLYRLVVYCILRELYTVSGIDTTVQCI